MAAPARTRQNGRRQNKNLLTPPSQREYGELLYGHKRKASHNHDIYNSSSKRVTRSKGHKSIELTPAETPDTIGKHADVKASKIPRLSVSSTKHLKRNSSASLTESQSRYSNNSPRTLDTQGYVTADSHNTSPCLPDNAGPALPGLSEDVNRREPSGTVGSFDESHVEKHNFSDQPCDHSNISETLDIINQKLQKLDKLDDISTSLTGEINRVQSQVGEVSNQVNTVKTDLNRCEEKWEAGNSAMLGRIGKVEQSFQAFEQRWQSGNTDLLDKISSVQSGMEDNSSRVKRLEDELNYYKEKWESLGSLEQKIKTAANDKFSQLKDIITDEVREEVSQEMRNAQSKSEREIRYERLKKEAYNKRHNLVVFGLPECPTPEEDLKAVSTFFSTRMNFKKLPIECVYRLGTVGSRPRPLVVRFKEFTDRWAVWNKKSKIKYEKDVPVWLQEDLPKRLREDIRVLQRVAKTARSCPEKYGDVKVKDYKISINGKTYDREHLHQLPSELSPAMVYTPCSERACVFFTKHSPFSNHFLSAFTIEGIRFSCIEQYLAVQKAHLVNNKSLAREAMESSDPADHKVVLNKLRSEASDEWFRRAPDFIKVAVKAKFSQNQHLTKFLLDSHPLQIGEASRDKFWGIGLPLESPDILDTSKWAPGGNLLGRTLESFREELLKTANFPK